MLLGGVAVVARFITLIIARLFYARYSKLAHVGGITVVKPRRVCAQVQTVPPAEFARSVHFLAMAALDLLLTDLRMGRCTR